jgi:hypothetical protein
MQSSDDDFETQPVPQQWPQCSPVHDKRPSWAGNLHVQCVWKVKQFT